MLVVPLLILAIARITLFIIANSVFEFYVIFVLGVAISKYDDILGKYGFLTDDRAKLLKYSAMVTVSFAAVLFLHALVFRKPIRGNTLCRLRLVSPKECTASSVRPSRILSGPLLLSLFLKRPVRSLMRCCIVAFSLLRSHRTLSTCSLCPF